MQDPFIVQIIQLFANHSPFAGYIILAWLYLMEQWITCDAMRSHRHTAPLPFRFFVANLLGDNLLFDKGNWRLGSSIHGLGLQPAIHVCLLGVLMRFHGARVQTLTTLTLEGLNLPRLKHIHCQLALACHAAGMMSHYAILAPAWRSHLSATRVGEATNPGPPDTSLQCAITNPTSIVSKASVYRDLARKFGIQLFAASETSATATAQASFSRRIRRLCPRLLWSQPVPDHRVKTDGTPSMRGKASGVALLTQQKARQAQGTLPHSWIATSRLLHTVVSVGSIHIQMMIVYALPSSHSGSNQFNNDLLEQAMRAIDHLPIPAIVLGDFNGNPEQWEQGHLLRERGFTDLKHHHARLQGGPMPPTCRDVTHPDNAYFCPKTASWLTQIHVVDDHYFDTHKVVTFKLAIPSLDCHTLSYPMPQTFLDLPLDPDIFEQVYGTYRQEHLVGGLEGWGQQLEHVIDETHRLTQCKLRGCQYSETTALPKKYRGRCQPRKLTKKPVQTFTKPGRPGDYNPEMEVHTFATRAKVRQVRRLKSLMNALAKRTWTSAQRKQATNEWIKILRCKAFQGNFILWAQQYPEIPGVPFSLPSFDIVQTLYQLTKFETDQALWFDRKVWLDKIQYRQHLDRTCGGHTRAFAELRNSDQGSTHELHQMVHDDAILVETDTGVLQAFLDKPAQFTTIDPVYIDTVRCRCIAIADHYIEIIASQPLAITDCPVQVSQKQILQHPNAIAAELQNFWNKYWNLSEQQLIMSPDLESIIDQLPPLVAPDSFDFSDKATWHLYSP